jgi:hypothetical protein
MRTVAACAAFLAAVGCGTEPAAPAPHEAGADADAQPIGMRAVDAERQFGEYFEFASGVVVTVSTPRPFRPSTTASPSTDRAIAVELFLRNDSASPYQLSGMSVTATAAGEPLKQVHDAAKGFGGIVDASAYVQPAQALRLRMAFAVPDEPSEIRLSVRPDPSHDDTVCFVAWV